MFLLLKLFDVFECTHLVHFGQPIHASAKAPKDPVQGDKCTMLERLTKSIAYLGCRGEIVDVVL